MERGKRSSFESLPPFSPNGFISFHPFPLSSSCEKESTYKVRRGKGRREKRNLSRQKKAGDFFLVPFLNIAGIELEVSLSSFERP